MEIACMELMLVVIRKIMPQPTKANYDQEAPLVLPYVKQESKIIRWVVTSTFCLLMVRSRIQLSSVNKEKENCFIREMAAL